MGQFQYSANKTTAVVNFQAHKFPYTTSVYYQCHVHLCLKANGGCANTVTFLKQNCDYMFLIDLYFSHQIVVIENVFGVKTKQLRMKVQLQ